MRAKVYSGHFSALKRIVQNVFMNVSEVREY